jgi:hypothetical protein
MRFPIVFLSLLPGLGLAWAVYSEQTASAAELVRNFQGRPYDARSFFPTGVSPRRALQVDARGLRIRPAQGESKLPVGLITYMGVHGDFEITMAFEIVRLDKPAGGHGAGVSLYITAASLDRQAATLGRFLRPDGEAIFLCHRAGTSPGEGRKHQAESSPTTAISGNLRLVRRGKTLSYQFAEKDRASFRELYQTEWGDEDVDSVRIAAESGGSPTAVDVCIRSFRIQADGFGPVRPIPQPSRWPIGLMVCLAAIPLALGGLWFWVRRHRSS